MPPELLIIVGIALAVLFAIFNHLAAKKRREEMAELARSLGFRFSPGPDGRHDEEYGHFEIFRRGHSRVALNTMTGKLPVDGRTLRVVAGDYRYRVTSGSGKGRNTRTYRFSYVILELSFDPPDLLIRPEGMFDKLAGVFGFDDIDFESAEFSKRFYVKSPDKKFAYDVIHPRMMEFLLKGLPAAIDIERGRICFADGRRRWEPPQFRRHFDYLERFLRLWPEHLMVQLDGGVSHAR
ncbi:MAG: hypothetical protein V2A76_00210 [Planctomycetota bacterium]